MKMIGFILIGIFALEALSSIILLIPYVIAGAIGFALILLGNVIEKRQLKKEVKP